jgi:hypothetical protein
MAVDAIDGDVVVGGDLPSMTRAGVGDVFGIFNRLFAKANYSHGVDSSRILANVSKRVLGLRLGSFSLDRSHMRFSLEPREC